MGCEVRVYRLSPPYGKCDKEGGKGDYYYKGNYSVEGCFRSCLQVEPRLSSVHWLTAWHGSPERDHAAVQVCGSALRQAHVCPDLRPHGE